MDLYSASPVFNSLLITAVSVPLNLQFPLHYYPAIYAFYTVQNIRIKKKNVDNMMDFSNCFCFEENVKSSKCFMFRIAKYSREIVYSVPQKSLHSRVEYFLKLEWALIMLLQIIFRPQFKIFFLFLCCFFVNCKASGWTLISARLGFLRLL